LANSIIQDCRNLSIEVGKNLLNTTISIGISQFCISDNNLSSIIKRADDALYKAKNNGRNQIQVL